MIMSLLYLHETKLFCPQGHCCILRTEMTLSDWQIITLRQMHLSGA